MIWCFWERQLSPGIARNVWYTNSISLLTFVKASLDTTPSIYGSLWIWVPQASLLMQSQQISKSHHPNVVYSEYIFIPCHRKYSQSEYRKAVNVVYLTVGSLSKPRRRRQRKPHQTRGLMSKAIAVHVRYNLCSFLSRPLQNNNVKWQDSGSPKERGRRRLIFHISFGTERCHCIFSLSRCLEPLANFTCKI